MNLNLIINHVFLRLTLMNIKLVKDQKNRMKKTDRLIYNINNSNNNKK
jgi:hypothetical protein